MTADATPPADPAPGDSTPTDPAPTPSDPTPVEPTPTPGPTEPGPTEPRQQPSASVPPRPAPTPSSPGSAPGPWIPYVPSPAPGGAGPLAPVGPFPAAAPAAFGRVYPTNPWIYNDLPGTRFLDPRTDGQGRVVRRHMGIDAQGGVRQPIFAVADGIVVDGTWRTSRRDRHGFGNQVQIAHADGYATRYAHFASAPVVELGERVQAGQLIGYMGGSQRGDLHRVERHLHFEVTKDGQHVDPIAFLTGAGTADPADPAAAETAPATDSRLLYEIREKGDGGYASISTGISVGSDVFTAIDMGARTATVMVSEGGMLNQIAVVDGEWTKTPTGLALDATSISGADTGTGSPELFAVEDGKLLHIVRDATGWTKTWTGHDFSGTVSAVALPGNRLHAMLQQSGYLYHLTPAEGGLWNVSDTRLEVGAQVDAVYVDGPAPEAMTAIDGEVIRITRGDVAWDAQSTGLSATGPLTAAYEGGGWPLALTAEDGVLGVTRVTDRVWTRFAYDLQVPGAIDAVVLDGDGTVLYSVG
ncbi:M23 family metallopeptidase [Microbacterium cremeum]|uniref:M23 family metallopeptidase n=1 Tax=Microbacterium cremeum TaxID=2782169 RepID=UPI00188997F1|nr:M23 family metallopeptidase [Microbacterium cremeum]